MRRYGVIGRPLAHSASARYFAEKFAREGIADARYDAFELGSIDELPKLLEELPELCGFNVTIPYKRAIIPLLDRLSPEAARIGAVNCVRRDGSRLTGYNTDAAGLRASFDSLLGEERPERALVLGSGGAARAVIHVLAERGIAARIVSRDPARGDCTYGTLRPEEVAGTPLIVQATPLGMWPRTEEAPGLRYDLIGPRHRLLDLVYNPPLTRFLALGRERGARILNGAVMFRTQAEASWTTWNSGRAQTDEKMPERTV